MASARPDRAASHLLRKSRIWLPDALPSSLGSPCAAYASMNSYASSMALQREASAALASSPGVGGEASAEDGVMAAGQMRLVGWSVVTRQRSGSWCSRYWRRVIQPKIIDFVIHHFSGRTAK